MPPMPQDLRDSLIESIKTNRPLIYHLTPDSSWLISLPLPSSSSAADGGVRKCRYRYNIVIDPWLSGPQIDFFSWFSLQTHASPAAIPNIAALEELLQAIEKTSSEHATKDEQSQSQSRGNDFAPSNSFIDALFISHEFTDHCHEATLKQCNPRIPVFATTKAASTIQKWAHFATVTEIPELPTHHHGADALNVLDVAHVDPLPSWLGVARLVESHDLSGSKLHSALMLVFDLQGSSTASGQPSSNLEAIVYTPHGIPAKSAVIDLLAPPQAQLNPPLSFLALLHGLHEVYIGGPQINLGGINGAALVKKLGCKYWLRTHDEVKKGKGFVGWILSRRVVGWGEALEMRDEVGNGDEKGSSGDGADGVKLNEVAGGGGKDEVQFVKIGNGECMVLE